MTDINVIVLVGRLTKDCESRTTQSGMAVTRFSIANNYRRKVGEEWKEEANFFDIVLIGKSAESLKQYLTKGRQVSVKGELRQSRWTNQDGQNQSRIEVIAEDVQLMASSQNQQTQQAQPQQYQQSQVQQQYQMPPIPPQPQQMQQSQPVQQQTMYPSQMVQQAQMAQQNQQPQLMNGPEAFDDIPF